MSDLNDRFKYGLLMLVVTAILAAGGFIHRSCSRTTVHEVPVQLRPITVTDSAPRLSTHIPDGADTVNVNEILRERDSLRLLLRRIGVRTRFTTDTIVRVSQGATDTVRVECDEVGRSITLDVRPGTRMVQIPVVIPSKPWIETYAQGGVFYDGVTTQPYGAVGASINLGQIALVLQAESRIDPVALRMKPGINAGIRYNF